MRHEQRWHKHYEALCAYEKRYGDAIVPTDHVEFLDSGECISLGNWVSYMRTRYKQNALAANRIQLLESLSSWTWGPVRPGPKSKDFIAERNSQIYSEYSNGETLAKIGARYRLSRQRVHQIVKEYENGK
jgi:hypothetical protein